MSDNVSANALGINRLSALDIVNEYLDKQFFDNEASITDDEAKALADIEHLINTVLQSRSLALAS